MTITLITFIGFLLLFTIIGISSTIKSKKTTADYLIASRNIHPVLTSLSSAATNNSGYMFIGLIGFTYMFGISAIWVQIGWVIGDYFAWKGLYTRVRKKSEEAQVSTFPGLLGYSRGKTNQLIVIISGLITLVFLSIYASAQLKAGSKALHVLFDWDYSTGAIIGAVMVLLYCIASGIRASIWTDAVQAIVMIVSMSILLGMAFMATGSPVALYHKLYTIDPNLTTIFPADLAFGAPLYVLGWVMAGFAAAGQPHIQIRTMSINSPEEISIARPIYILWFTLFSIATLLVGLYSRVLLPDIAAFDPELALPTLAMDLMPAFFVGLILAGLFSATMSTADSLVLSASAALTHDINAKWEASRLVTKLGTVFITVFALITALYAPENVFELVLINWSILGAAFTPLLIIRIFDLKITSGVALLMMITGIGTVLFWRYGLQLTNHVYEILPGFAASTLIYVVFLGFESLRKK